MSFYWYAALFAAPFTGGIMGFFLNRGKESFTKLLLAFSGSFLLSLSILVLMPHVFSGHDSEFAGMFVLAGFLLQVFLDFFTKGADHGHYHPDEKKHSHRIPVSLIAALSIHSFIEGIPIGTGAYHNAGFGTAMITGIALHEVPAAFVLVSVLRANHLNNKIVFPLMVLYASMSLIGALVGSQFDGLNEESLHYILALVIGSFLHISTTILFESSENHRFNRMKLTAILIGIVVGLLNLLVHH
ncbi:MAG: ZIP family metal transporter [Bacteroidetes bacterium]|nr:MAG: ZIP family metal transporter [Bacteroidota bacterium]